MKRGEDKLITEVRHRGKPPLSADVAILVDAAKARHGGVAAVLFYGSCLRNGRADVGIADFYLLVDAYQSAFASRFQAIANRLLRPSVFYIEVPRAGKILRAKYAILTLKDFCKGTHTWFHSYIWGRFAQPSGLVYARDPIVTAWVYRAMAQAVRTFVRRTLPQAPETFTARELWRVGLRLCYRCELRSERPSAAAHLVDAAPGYYEAVTPLAVKGCGFDIDIVGDAQPFWYRSHISSQRKALNRLAWRARRVQGKVLSVLRLLKSLLTFEKGVDYVLWKIERHSGVRTNSPPACRRFPSAAICITIWRLFRRGAFR